MKIALLSVTTAALIALSSASSRYPMKRPNSLKSPEGPSQQCRDDAGPPWSDDEGAAYYEGQPNRAVLNSTGICPTPLAEACKSKGVLAAHMDGPIKCNGNGWHCRILPQKGWKNPNYVDLNMQLCNAPNADESDQGGHCHGSDSDNTYGWWVRDHWHRGYTGTLHCCCSPPGGSDSWHEGLKGLVNRCDYRREIKPNDLKRCRDANEDHPKWTAGSFEGGCDTYRKSHPFKEPVTETPDQCWTVEYFATWENAPIVPSQRPTAPPSDSSTRPPTAKEEEEEGEEEEEEEEEDENPCAELSTKRQCRMLRWRNTNVVLKGKYKNRRACVWKQGECAKRDHCKMLRTRQRCNRFGPKNGDHSCVFVRGRGCTKRFD